MHRSISVASVATAFLALVTTVFGQSFLFNRSCDSRCAPVDNCNAPPIGVADVGGSWQWMASRDEQQRRAAGLYNRYCIRCHGVDGRGVWDVPDVPNFADPIWQSSRTDEQLARLTWEGRGAVMPAFRGTLTWQESWALAYYIRELVPGSKPGRPPKNRDKQTSKHSKQSQPQAPANAPQQATPTATNHSATQFYLNNPPIILQSPSSQFATQRQQPIPSQGYSYPSYPTATNTTIFDSPSVLGSVPR